MLERVKHLFSDPETSSVLVFRLALQPRSGLFIIEILKALTGNATVEIVMRHYFKPK
jgi:hypothetical protein